MTTVLSILSALPSLIKAIIDLMKLIESVYDTGTGVQKKEIVLTSIQTMISNDDLWFKVKNIFSGLINMIALLNFGSSGKDPGS